MTRTPAEAEQENKSSAEEGGGGTSTDKKKELAPGSRILEFCILYFFLVCTLHFLYFVFISSIFWYFVFCFVPGRSPGPWVGERQLQPRLGHPAPVWKLGHHYTSDLSILVHRHSLSRLENLVIILLVAVFLVQVVEWHHFLLGLHVSCFYSDLLRATQE